MSVALFVASVLLVNFPHSDESPQAISAFYHDRGERAQQIASGYLLILAGLFLFWFLASLRVKLQVAEGRSGRLTSISFGAGLVCIGLFMAAGALEMSVAANIDFGDEKFASPEAVRLLPQLAVPVFFAAEIAGIAMIWATSVVIIRTATLARWVGWIGFVIAVALLFSPFVPVITFPLWVLIVSVALLLTPISHTGPGSAT